MKKIFYLLVMALMVNTAVIAQGKTKTSLLESKAVQMAKEQTEKDTRQYNLTAEQKKEIYKVNLELGRQKAVLGDRANDNGFQLKQEEEHFRKLQPLMKPGQMGKFIQDHQKAMNELTQH